MQAWVQRSASAGSWRLRSSWGPWWWRCPGGERGGGGLRAGRGGAGGAQASGTRGAAPSHGAGAGARADAEHAVRLHAGPCAAAVPGPRRRARCGAKRAAGHAVARVSAKSAAGQAHRIAFFPSASRWGQMGFQGFARVVNRTGEVQETLGTVTCVSRASPVTGAPNSENSVQWLARKIVADDRFAEAEVEFWWPAIMGNEVAETPKTSPSFPERMTLGSICA